MTATAWEAAEQFSRAVSVVAATEMECILGALGEVDHADTAAANWFTMSELQGLADRTMLTVQAELVRGWGVPAAVTLDALHIPDDVSASATFDRGSGGPGDRRPVRWHLAGVRRAPHDPQSH